MNHLSRLRPALLCAAIMAAGTTTGCAPGGEAGDEEPAVADTLSDALIVGATAKTRPLPKGPLLARIAASDATRTASSGRIVAWEVYQHQLTAQSMSAGVIVVGVTEKRKVVASHLMRRGDALVTVSRDGRLVAWQTGEGKKIDAVTGMVKTGRGGKYDANPKLLGAVRSVALEAIRSSEVDGNSFVVSPLEWSFATATPEQKAAFRSNFKYLLSGAATTAGGVAAAASGVGAVAAGAAVLAGIWAMEGALDGIKSIGGFPTDFWGSLNGSYVLPSASVGATVPSAAPTVTPDTPSDPWGRLPDECKPGAWKPGVKVTCI